MKVIGIGASAGGVEALLELFKNIPPNTGAAYVVVQHLAPNLKSLMDELLMRETEMDVIVIEKDIELKPDTIYLMPGSINLSIKKNKLISIPRPEGDILNLPIDIFFHDLGREKGKDAIAVILSGSGSDGSRGIRSVKEKGGIILVQEPDTAQFDGMPSTAIQLNIADSVMSPKGIGEQIVHITASTKSDAISELPIDLQKGQHNYYFERILSIVKTQEGVTFKEYRESTLIRRMEKRMLVHQIDNLMKYYEFVRHNSDEVSALYSDFLIGVTRFFRDEKVFEYLEKEIIPRVITLEPDDTKKIIRIWIVACSTGEEAYSIAMLLAEYLEKNNINRDFKIFASDVDKNAIRFASEGLYGKSIIADVPTNYLYKYFNEEGDNYRVHTNIKDKILFAYQDVLSDPPFIRMDLISCRNLLIYLKPKSQRKVMTNFHFALNEQGVMLLGPSESLGTMSPAFDTIHKKFNFFNKKLGGRILFHSEFRSNKERLRSAPQVHSRSTKTSNNISLKGINSEDELDPFSQYLIEHLAPISIFLNKSLDILYLNGSVDKFLNLPRAIAKLNIKGMANKEVVTLFKEGVNKALAIMTPVVFRNIQILKGEEKINCDIRFRKVDLSGLIDVVVLADVVIHDAIGKTEDSQGIEIRQEDYLLEQIHILERELSFSKRENNRLHNEIEATTEELQASNRELMASNEELQSTNEELQSVNEELFTVNSEFQIKNQELTLANSDINNLLKSTEIGTIFLDKELHIRKFTPAIHRQFNLLISDIGRPITDFSSNFKNLDIAVICKEVAQTGQKVEKAIKDNTSHQYLLRVLPYRTTDLTRSGFVITFININDLEVAQDVLVKYANSFQAVFENSDDIILMIDTDYKIIKANHPFAGQNVESLNGKVVTDCFTNQNNVTLKKALKSVKEKLKRVDIKIMSEFLNNEKISYNTNIIPVVEDKLLEAFIMILRAT